jgi:hypothetical protein
MVTEADLVERVRVLEAALEGIASCGTRDPGTFILRAVALRALGRSNEADLALAESMAIISREDVET